MSTEDIGEDIEEDGGDEGLVFFDLEAYAEMNPGQRAYAKAHAEPNDLRAIAEFEKEEARIEKARRVEESKVHAFRIHDTKTLQDFMRDFGLGAMHPRPESVGKFELAESGMMEIKSDGEVMWTEPGKDMTKLNSVFLSDRAFVTAQVTNVSVGDKSYDSIGSVWVASGSKNWVEYPIIELSGEHADVLLQVKDFTTEKSTRGYAIGRFATSSAAMISEGQIDHVDLKSGNWAFSILVKRPNDEHYTLAMWYSENIQNKWSRAAGSRGGKKRDTPGRAARGIYKAEMSDIDGSSGVGRVEDVIGATERKAVGESSGAEEVVPQHFEPKLPKMSRSARLRAIATALHRRRESHESHDGEHGPPRR